MRILVTDDEADLADAVATFLRREGYAVDVAHSGTEALDRIAYTDYDLVTLDLSLGDVDGLEVCRRILADDARPAPRILMLTARDSVAQRVEGLDHGADDYLVKPFALDELGARVRTLLRRDAAAAGGSLLEAGLVRLDTARHVVTVGGEVVALTAKEFALLRYFLAHAGEVLSQERLLEHVWDDQADPFTNTVRVTVGTLRRKLAATAEAQGLPSDLIETVIGAGYRLRDLG